MTDGERTSRLFIAQVTFRRDGARASVLPEGAEGASGWMAAAAEHEGQLVGLFRDSLYEAGLRLLAVDDVVELASIDEAEPYDPHLAANMRSWEPGRNTVWGTLYPDWSDEEEG